MLLALDTAPKRLSSGLEARGLKNRKGDGERKDGERAEFSKGNFGANGARAHLSFWDGSKSGAKLPHSKTLRENPTAAERKSGKSGVRSRRDPGNPLIMKLLRQYYESESEQPKIIQVDFKSVTPA